MVHGQKQAEIALLRFCQQLAREVELVVFDERLPDRQALRLQERVRHGAADEHGVGKLHQILHHFDLVGNFRAAQHRDERPLGMRNRLAEIGEFLFHQQAGGGLAHEFRDAHNRGVSAMRRAERVANEKPVAKRRELLRKLRVVGFFLGMKAHVFEQQHFRHYASALLFASASAPMQSAANSTGFPPSSSFRRAATGARTVLRIHFALGPPQMRGEHQPRAALGGQAQSRQRFADARVVRHTSAFERHVEIHADENALAGHFEIANR